MNNNTNALTRAELSAMFPCDFEEWRERGEKARYVMTTAVRRCLDIPDGWQVNGEYRNEFGGLFPVQLRFSPPGERFYLCVCSPGEISAEWFTALISADGVFVQILKITEVFAPECINNLLGLAGQITTIASTAHSVAAWLTGEVTL